jgi:hypothetical protein
LWDGLEASKELRRSSTVLHSYNVGSPGNSLSMEPSLRPDTTDHAKEAQPLPITTASALQPADERGSYKDYRVAEGMQIHINQKGSVNHHRVRGPLSCYLRCHAGNHSRVYDRLQASPLSGITKHAGPQLAPIDGRRRVCRVRQDFPAKGCAHLRMLRVKCFMASVIDIDFLPTPLGEPLSNQVFAGAAFTKYTDHRIG